MFIKAIKRLFGVDEEKEVSKTPSSCCSGHAPKAKKSAPGKDVSQKDLEGFVGYVVKELVDFPEDVRISMDAKNDCKVIQVICRAGDRGKIIGKKGKTIMALRALVAGAAGRMQDRYTVEVLDEEVKD